MILYKHRFFKSEIGLPYIKITHIYRLYSPLIKNQSMLVSTCVQNTPCLYQLAFNSLYIIINSCSFYTKTYGIELYHVLSILWRVAFFPYPDAWAVCDYHLIHGIIFIVPVIARNTLSICLWYHS